MTFGEGEQACVNGSEVGRELLLFASDAVLVAVESSVQKVAPVAPLEVCHRVAARMVSRAVAADNVALYDVSMAQKVESARA
jgi:hypothetical protein